MPIYIRTQLTVFIGLQHTQVHPVRCKHSKTAACQSDSTCFAFLTIFYEISFEVLVILTSLEVIIYLNILAVSSYALLLFFSLLSFQIDIKQHTQSHNTLNVPTMHILFIYLSESHLNYPRTLGECHDVPLLPEEGGVRALDHLKLAELLHGIHLFRRLVSYLQAHMCIIKKHLNKPFKQHTFCNMLTHVTYVVFFFTLHA